MSWFRIHKGRAFALLALTIILAAGTTTRADTPPKVEFRDEPGRLVISVGGAPLATYVYRDPSITRPYFAHVHAPGGVQVTRNHPPVAGKDPTDHATFHPGLWLAFGDLSGADDWRNRARVEHDQFVEPPSASAGEGTFTVRNRYRSPDGDRTVCDEVCRYRVLVRPSGYLLTTESEFTSDSGDFTFGDQEEMGFGLRVATPLTVQHGGRIVTSDGSRNEREVRGTQPDWCDYSGTISGQFVGVTLMPDPKNFRKSWFHARDYGLLVANPFGRKALTKGPESRVTVKRGERFHLGFGILLHASPTSEGVDLAAAYRDYLAQMGQDRAFRKETPGSSN